MKNCKISSMKLLENALNKLIYNYNQYEGNKGNFQWSVKKSHPRLFKFIKSSFGKSFNEKVFCLLNNITCAPSCKQCSTKPVAFKNINAGYKTYCSDICANKDSELWEKRKASMLKKYGYEHALQNPEILEKTKTKLKKSFAPDGQGRKNYQTTMLETYGVSNPMELDEFKNKIKVSHSLRTSTEKQITSTKIKQTKLNKYGSAGFNNSVKRKQTLKNRYNVDYTGQIHSSVSWLSIVDKKEFLIQSLPHLHPLKIAKDYNVAWSTIYKLINQFDLKDLVRKTFNAEYEIIEFIKILNFKYTTNDRKILKGKELDIYLPHANLAIEHNGIYWHSTNNGKNHLYHLSKTIICEQNNISLFHIFDFEWINNKDIVCALIKHKLKYNINIPDDFYISIVDEKLKNEFLLKNNLFGIVESNLNIGLFIDGKLNQLLTFFDSEITSFAFDIESEFKILFKEIFDFYIREYDPNFVKISIDRRYDFKDIFLNLGFHINSHDLPRLLSFDSNQIWDCGKTNLIWVK